MNAIAQGRLKKEDPAEKLQEVQGHKVNIIHRLPVYYKRILTVEQMEDMGRARYVGRGVELLCPVRGPLPQISKCSLTGSSLCPFLVA